jgi:hypothetical protein
LLREHGRKHRLRFKLTQNDSMEFPFSEITMLITETSTAGYVAMRREVINLPRPYEIPPGRPCRFNPSSTKSRVTARAAC